MSFSVQNTIVEDATNLALYDNITTTASFCYLNSSTNIPLSGHGFSGEDTSILIEFDTITLQNNFTFVSTAPYTVSTSVSGFYLVNWTFSGFLSDGAEVADISAYICTLQNPDNTQYTVFSILSSNNVTTVSFSAVIKLQGFSDGIQFYFTGLPSNPTPYMTLYSNIATITSV